MPPLFACDVCGYTLDPRHSSVMRLAEVWLVGRGKTVKAVQTEKYVYIHSSCFNKDQRDVQEALF
jgi:hypothetical protein